MSVPSPPISIFQERPEYRGAHRFGGIIFSYPLFICAVLKACEHSLYKSERDWVANLRSGASLVAGGCKEEAAEGSYPVG